MAKTELDKFAALLHSRWRKGATPDGIQGEWWEDHSPFSISAPAHLRDLLVEMQNMLADKYRELEDARARVRALERDASKLGT